MEAVRVELRSVTPLLMHRYGGAKPSAEKAPRGKKTQAHIDAEYRKDWFGAAYWQDGTFHIPPEIVEAAVAEAAKDFRLGKTFKKAIWVLDYFLPLRIYDSPEDTKGWQASGELESYYRAPFIDIRGVRLGPSKIDRCRPIFHNWGLSFTVRFDETQISADQLQRALTSMAIGDFRPRYGRSKIVTFELEAVAA